MTAGARHQPWTSACAGWGGSPSRLSRCGGAGGLGPHHCARERRRACVRGGARPAAETALAAPRVGHGCASTVLMQQAGQGRLRSRWPSAAPTQAQCKVAHVLRDGGWPSRCSRLTALPTHTSWGRRKGARRCTDDAAAPAGMTQGTPLTLTRGSRAALARRQTTRCRATRDTGRRQSAAGAHAQLLHRPRLAGGEVPRGVARVARPAG